MTYAVSWRRERLKSLGDNVIWFLPSHARFFFPLWLKLAQLISKAGGHSCYSPLCLPVFPCLWLVQLFLGSSLICILLVDLAVTRLQPGAKNLGCSSCPLVTGVYRKHQSVTLCCSFKISQGENKASCNSKVRKKKKKEKYYYLGAQRVPANTLTVGFHIILLILD